jgi:hypothetical protein
VGAGGSYCGKGIILARFFGSFFIDWKNECPSGEDNAWSNT